MVVMKLPKKWPKPPKSTPWDDGMRTVDAIAVGYPVSVIGEVSRESGIEEARIRDLVGIPPSTFARRRRAGRLSKDESDRLASLRHALGHVRYFFGGDAGRALAWIEKSARAFDGRKPVELLRSTFGARQVEGLIDKIACGVFT